jgi:hypothetical protein
MQPSNQLLVHLRIILVQITGEPDGRRAVQSGLSAGRQTESMAATNRSQGLQRPDAAFYRREGCSHGVGEVGGVSGVGVVRQ